MTKEPKVVVDHSCSVKVCGNVSALLRKLPRKKEIVRTYAKIGTGCHVTICKAATECNKSDFIYSDMCHLGAICAC